MLCGIISIFFSLNNFPHTFLPEAHWYSALSFSCMHVKIMTGNFLWVFFFNFWNNDFFFSLSLYYYKIICFGVSNIDTLVVLILNLLYVAKKHLQVWIIVSREHFEYIRATKKRNPQNFQMAQFNIESCLRPG